MTRIYKPLTLVLAGTLLAASCSSSDSAVEPTEDTTSAQTEAETSTADSDATNSDDLAENSANLTNSPVSDLDGRDGPIRELDGFAAWADVDLHPFLVEVISLPEEVRLPAGLALTYMEGNQTYWGPSDSSYSVSTEFLPSFDRNSFKETVPALLESDWTATGVDEDLENNSTTLTFTPNNDKSEIEDVSYRYTDGDTSRQPEVRIYVDGRTVEGQAELVFNMDIWGWLNDAAVEPTLEREYVRISVDTYNDDVSFYLDWDGPIGRYQNLADFYIGTDIGNDLMKGEIELDDDPWIETSINISRESDGLEGQIEIIEFDAEREPGVSISGTVSL